MAMQLNHKKIASTASMIVGNKRRLVILTLIPIKDKWMKIKYVRLKTNIAKPKSLELANNDTTWLLYE